MPGPWKWYAAIEGERDCFGFESETREDAIAAFLKDEGPNWTIVVCEARLSSALKHEGADVVPFVKMRNEEVIDLSLRALATPERGG